MKQLYFANIFNISKAKTTTGVTNLLTNQQQRIPQIKRNWLKRKAMRGEQYKGKNSEKGDY